MEKVKLIDSTFPHNPTIGLAGQNVGELPESFRWDRAPGPSEIKFFTDIRLHEVKQSDAVRNVALLLEAPCLSDVTYKRIVALKDYFAVILTHNRALLEKHGEPFYYYPFGGSWIRRWGLFSKTKDVSILTSAKDLTRGHKLRHEIAQKFGGEIDVYGEPYTERLPSKVPALRDYRYSVIVENCREDWWFTEKLIDCMSQGTIPIYWGCPDIGQFFNERGILSFADMRQFRVVLASATKREYENRLSSVTINFALAHDYRCAEDWIAGHYPWIFKL